MSADRPDVLTIEADGPVRTVTINRPDELNAVDEALHRALAKVWRQLAADRDAKVVVLTGAGRAFSAGGDLDWITSFLDDPVARDESLREGAQIIDELLRFPLPVIAAVNGPAVGLGCSIAMLCDVVLMSETRLPRPIRTSSVGLVAGRRRRRVLAAAGADPAHPGVPLHRRPDPGRHRGRARPGSRAVAARRPAGRGAQRLAERFAAQPAEALQATKRVVNMHLARALERGRARPASRPRRSRWSPTSTDERLLALRARTERS